jgi:Undecaprenyl-phosphate glucose phosphotransferase
MLKKHSKFFEKLIILVDSVIITLCWIAAYYLRFVVELQPLTKGIPDYHSYLKILFLIIPIWIYVFKSTGLYSPRRSGSRIEEAIKVIKGSLISVIFLIALAYFLFEYKISRLVLIYFMVLNVFSLIIVRASIRSIFRKLRRKGYNLRYVLIVGAGKLGQEVLNAIEAVPQMGYRVMGFLARSEDKVGEKVNGVKVIGLYEDIDKVMKKHDIDQVVVAIPLGSYKRMEFVLKHLMDEIVDIKVVPDVYQYVTLRGGIEELNGLPIINLRESPLYGWNMIIKRLMDILVSLLTIAVAAPLMLLFAIIIKATSPGPIFYRQERMGLDGKTFNMLKFRSMRANAEKETGAVWAARGDGRRTRIGRFLRKTSMDELPQLFNVLRGEMTLVGPRPERPVFVEEFKKKVPKYMLRHKMKAGMTGWAQINGWRGNTSIQKRIEHDLYYIENWTIALDIKILVKTIFTVLVDKEAY